MNKNKKKQIIIIVTVVALVILIGIIIVYFALNKTEKKSTNHNKESDKKEIEPTSPPSYIITYNDDALAGMNSKISIYDNKIEIVTTNPCFEKDCKADVENKSYKCSKETINKLKDYLDKNYKEKNITINKSSIKGDGYKVIPSILMGEYWLEIALEEHKYLIEYSETDNRTYFIIFKEDGSIMVKKATINDNYDITRLESYMLYFTKEKLDILNNYVKKIANYKKTNYITRNATLTKDEINIYKSIVENNEKYLDENDIKLLYTIFYNGLNCQTPTLYLYNDNTFEYYYTYDTGNTKLKPVEGSYGADINNIIKNINKYKSNGDGQYVIMDSKGKYYTTYNNNIELNDFLNSLGVVLEKCIEKQH